MGRASLLLPILVLVAVQPQAAHADWDDLGEPKWNDTQPQQAPRPQMQPQAPVLEEEAHFFSRPHSQAEIKQYMLLRVAQARAKQMAQIQAAQMSTPTVQLKPGALLPGQSTYKSSNPFGGSAQTPFFNGITTQQAYDALKQRPYTPPKLGQSPDWAKTKYETREFRDDVEHFGNEDSMGFTK